MYNLLIILSLLLGGCANFTIQGTMCDEIEREQGATVPKECRNYNEEEADKAFNKVVDEKKVSDKDIEFDIEEK